MLSRILIERAEADAIADGIRLAAEHGERVTPEMGV